jgi:hypothetical protein
VTRDMKRPGLPQENPVTRDISQPADNSHHPTASRQRDGPDLAALFDALAAIEALVIPPSGGRL